MIASTSKSTALHTKTAIPVRPQELSLLRLPTSTSRIGARFWPPASNHERSTAKSAGTGCVGGGGATCSGGHHMNLTLIPPGVAAAIAAVIAGTAGFGAAWTLRGMKIDSLKIEAKDAIIQQQRGARTAIDRATTAVITAQNKAATRNTRIAADVGRAGDSGNGLRVASATAVRTSTADSDACGSTVAAYGVILDEGSRLLGEVAAVADQCISDNQALTEAWQK